MVPYSPSSTSAAKVAESSIQTDSIVKVCVLPSSLTDVRYLFSVSSTGLDPLSHRTRLGFDRVRLRQHSLPSRTSMSLRGTTTAQGSSTQFITYQDWSRPGRFQNDVCMYLGVYVCMCVHVRTCTYECMCRCVSINVCLCGCINIS